jgi:hypothetical protein
MEESTFSRGWFITGISTGFGYLLAEEALKRWESVTASADFPENKSCAAD